MAIIQTKATELAKRYSDRKFTANTGWFTRFCARFDFVNVGLAGEAGDVDVTKCKAELKDIRT